MLLLPSYSVIKRLNYRKNTVMRAYDYTEMSE